MAMRQVEIKEARKVHRHIVENTGWRGKVETENRRGERARLGSQKQPTQPVLPRFAKLCAVEGAARVVACLLAPSVCQQMTAAAAAAAA
eukprot:6012886-Pleurochrysis_carterae.AAC.1